MTKTINLSFIQKYIAAVVMVSAMFFGMLAFAQPANAQYSSTRLYSANGSPDIAALRAQIAVLQAQLDALLVRANGGTQTGGNSSTVLRSSANLLGNNYPGPYADPAPAGYNFTRNLGLGDTNSQVRALNSCLAGLGYYNGADSNAYSATTRRAVEAYQTAQNIVSSGNPWTTGYGYVGPLTRASLNEVCNRPGGSNNDNNNNGVSELDASPTSGSAPLEVTFETYWTGQAGRANIDYGDGSEERVTGCNAPADACTAPGVNTHTYTEVGTYTVTVTAELAAVGEIARTTIVVTEDGETDNETPDEDGEYTLTANPNSGRGNVLVRFTASHGDNSTVRPSQTGGVETRVNWGDGSSPVWVSCSHRGDTFGECNNPKALFHVYTEPGTYQAQLLRRNSRTGEREVLDRQTITVRDASDYETADDLDVELTKNAQEQSVTLTYTTQDCDMGYYVRWGDGEVEDVVDDGDCTEDHERELTHTYENEGSYNVRFTYADQSWNQTVTIGTGGVEEVYARVRYNQTPSTGTAVNGNRVLLGDGTRYSNDEWFKLTENGEFINDGIRAVSVEGAESFRGLVVSRLGDGNIEVAHVGRNDSGTGHEVSEGRIVVRGGTIPRNSVVGTRFERNDSASTNYETRYQLDYVLRDSDNTRRVNFGTYASTGADVFNFRVTPDGEVQGASTTNFEAQIANAITALNAALDRLEASL